MSHKAMVVRASRRAVAVQIAYDVIYSPKPVRVFARVHGHLLHVKGRMREDQRVKPKALDSWSNWEVSPRKIVDELESVRFPLMMRIRIIAGSLFLVIATSAITTGVISVGNFLGAGNRPVEDSNPVFTTFYLTNISAEDQWIYGYNIFLSPINSIRSDSRYALLMVARKPQEKSKPERGNHLFMLSNYIMDRRVEKPVSIDGSFLADHPDTPEVVVLDMLQFFPTNLSGVAPSLGSAR